MESDRPWVINADLSGLEGRTLLSPPVQPHLLPNSPLSLLLSHLTISMFLEHASTPTPGPLHLLSPLSGMLSPLQFN